MTADQSVTYGKGVHLYVPSVAAVRGSSLLATWKTRDPSALWPGLGLVSARVINGELMGFVAIIMIIYRFLYVILELRIMEYLVSIMPGHVICQHCVMFIYLFMDAS